MFDLITPILYTPIYYYVLLLVTFITYNNTRTHQLESNETLKLNKSFGLVVLVFVMLYMGLRPVNRVFTDMLSYNRLFENYADGATITSPSDIMFHVFAKFSSKILTSNQFFLACAVLYIIPLYVVSKKWFKTYWFYSFLFLISSFSFWAYGVNGIRNGIAGSLFLLGVSRDKRLWQIFWIVIAVNFHKSMLLPSIGFFIAHFYNQPKKMITFWMLCIPISLVGGGFFETIFSAIGFDDHRLDYLTGEVDAEKFENTGFRWDFLLYSATAVFAGWYYIVKRQYKDKIYFLLFNTYVFTNAFWILVIRANYTNRFAYLSWFMISIIIIFPLLRKKVVPNQHKLIGTILIVSFAFTFLMNVILKN